MQINIYILSLISGNAIVTKLVLLTVPILSRRMLFENNFAHIIHITGKNKRTCTCRLRSRMDLIGAVQNRLFDCSLNQSCIVCN
jgi:hypothetical protein